MREHRGCHTVIIHETDGMSGATLGWIRFQGTTKGMREYRGCHIGIIHETDCMSGATSGLSGGSRGIIKRKSGRATGQGAFFRREREGAGNIFRTEGV